MKILFDHHLFITKFGGAAKYFAMLAAYLPADSWRTTALWSFNVYAKEKGLFTVHKKLFKGQGRLSSLLNTGYTNHCIAHSQYDVFHQTNFGTEGLNYLKDKPMVTTYHDRNLSTIDPHPEIVKRQKQSLLRADAVVCVSNTTKKDMLELFDLDEKKVHVIYHGIEIPDSKLLPEEKIFDFPYILYVGRRSEYKNFPSFLKAFAEVRRLRKDIRLVCTYKPLTPEEKIAIKSLGLEGSVEHVMADEATMKRLYRDCFMFVFPSKYEGFGMPILEAWAMNAPVVLSDASCFPEIAGDAALYFDPYSIEDMRDTMIRVIDDSRLHESLKEKGAERVKRFSWQRCADEHMEVYKTVIR
ncbi:MAG: glycosyltransferase family 4 protein [Bacteroidaceae bacterium]|nr:glycosyltransferase family 4 protein [Bacteroidaceae bacterium]